MIKNYPKVIDIGLDPVVASTTLLGTTQFTTGYHNPTTRLRHGSCHGASQIATGAGNQASFPLEIKKFFNCFFVA